MQLGPFIHRLNGRKGAPVAIKAGAGKMAQAFYNALTHGMDYVEAGAEKYQQQFRQRENKVLEKLALQYNYNIIELQKAT
jgi:hypothetical protein